METEEQIRQYKNSTAGSFASLSLGLWAVALVGYSGSGISWATYFLVVVGAISALFGVYLILPWDWKQNQTLRYLETKRVMKVAEALGWLIVLAVFAVGLIQTRVYLLIFTGIIIGITAYVVFLISISRIGKDKKEKLDKKQLI